MAGSKVPVSTGVIGAKRVIYGQKRIAYFGWRMTRFAFLFRPGTRSQSDHTMNLNVQTIAARTPNEPNVGLISSVNKERHETISHVGNQAAKRLRGSIEVDTSLSDHPHG